MRVLTTVRSTLEASLVRGRLREAGMPSMQRSERLPEYGDGACSILVEDDDYDRARQVLAEEDGGFSDEELARLSKEAARRARESPPRPSPEPAVTESRGWLRGLFARERAPENPFGR